MKNNVDYLPIWKNNASAEERLQELSHMARKHPEQFNKFIIVFQEIDDESNSSYERQVCFNLTTTEALGLLRFGEVALLSSMHV